MSQSISRRSFLGASTSVLGTALLSSERPAFASVFESSASHRAALDGYAQEYMRIMHSPGMTVALLSPQSAETRVYGWSDLTARTPIRPEQPFWIGSICKSFVGLVAMQLRDEGKLDLHRPVLEIMPDLPLRNEYGPITTHHLLTHTSGLPNWLQLVGADSSQVAAQAYKPGERFAYCNLGYDTLGLLIAHLDGRSWPEAVTARILKPLGMTGALAQIDSIAQARMPIGYQHQFRDRPNTVADPLVAVGYVLMANAAGSIIATADDMNRYMRMLVQRGEGPAGRIVSEEGFRLFSTPYIKAPVLSAAASYGYGIGVETIDGRTMLRHTGGATAFASSILVDLDGHVGAFASINAMQGYRPNPITKFAVDMLYAESKNISAPQAAPIADPLTILHPEQYAGVYKAPGSETLTVAVQGNALMVTSAKGSTKLRPVGQDAFAAADGSVLGDPVSLHSSSEFALLFGRAEAHGEAGNGSEAASTTTPLVDLSYGPHWYAGERFNGSHEFSRVEDAHRYVGNYAIDSPWTGPVRVVERKGKLWLDGEAEMKPTGRDRFSVAGGEGSLDLEFVKVLDGKAQALLMEGVVLMRVNLAAGS